MLRKLYIICCLNIIWNKNKTLFPPELHCLLLAFALIGWAKESMASATCVKLVNQGSSAQWECLTVRTDMLWRWQSVLIQFIQKPSAKPRLARSHLFTLSPSMPDLELTLKFIGKLKEERRSWGQGKGDQFYDWKRWTASEGKVNSLFLQLCSIIKGL